MRYLIPFSNVNVRCFLIAQLALMPLFGNQTPPTDRWRESSPEAQGVDSRSLADAVEHIGKKGLPIHSMLVVRHGVIVLDAYFYPYEPTVPHDVASVTKSVTSIVTGIAIDQGYVKSVKEPVLELLGAGGEVSDDPRKRRMTVEALLTMTSGMACGSAVAHTDEAELEAMRRSPDWIGYALTLPMRSEPGSEFAYCSVNNHLLSAAITAKTGESLETFAHRNLFEPLGIRELLWPSDPKGLSHGWGDLHLYPRDMAKLGYLYLHGGVWGDRRIVSEQWVKASIESHVAVRDGVGYGYSWWINVAREPHIPEAEGRGGQRISIVPDKDAVVVFTSGGADTDEVAPYLLRALSSDVALAPNPAAFNRLGQALKAARLSPKAMPAPELPDTARRVSGRRYSFDSNDLGLESLSLVFDRRNEARVTLEIGHENWVGAVGLDGVYRFSPKGLLGLPLAASGRWRSNAEFLLDVNLVPNITRILFAIRFEGNRAEVDATDTTGSFDGLHLSGLAHE